MSNYGRLEQIVLSNDQWRDEAELLIGLGPRYDIEEVLGYDAEFFGGQIRDSVLDGRLAIDSLRHSAAWLNRLDRQVVDYYGALTNVPEYDLEEAVGRRVAHHATRIGLTQTKSEKLRSSLQRLRSQSSEETTGGVWSGTRYYAIW